MYEYKYSVQEVSYKPVDIMGNYLQSALYSEPKDSPFPFDIIKTYMTSVTTTSGSATASEAPQSWFATIDDVESVDEDSELIRSLLPEEKQKVKRFRFPDDQKRALLSILLQRALIRETFHVTDKDYDLVRSREVSFNHMKTFLIAVSLTTICAGTFSRCLQGKPFAKSRHPDLDFGTWNFNVSHHGKYVCIVAHPHLLVSCDAMLVQRFLLPCSSKCESCTALLYFFHLLLPLVCALVCARGLKYIRRRTYLSTTSVDLCSLSC
jgi:hypothetical protein